MESSFWISLSLIEGLGTKTLKNLYDYKPNLSYTDIIVDENIENVIKNKSVYERIIDKEYLEIKVFEAEKIVANHLKKGIEIVAINSKKYPKLLRAIEDPPILLYCKGNIELLEKEENLAVIGTREPTKYGIAAAKKIARIFAERGFTIVSGLALGIDTAGHQGALDAEGGRTIAVMAGSLDNIYPKENKTLAEEILQNEGLLISEIPLGHKTFKGSFVARDRIQSGMSLGVCPIQAPLKSGTHHTINFAEKQNRLVFCPIPIEPADILATQGIYELINTKKVITISNASDYDFVQKLLLKKQLELKSKADITEEVTVKRKEKNTKKIDINYNLFSIMEEAQELQEGQEKEVLIQPLKSFIKLCHENSLSEEKIKSLFLEELYKDKFKPQ